MLLDSHSLRCTLMPRRLKAVKKKKKNMPKRCSKAVTAFNHGLAPPGSYIDAFTYHTHLNTQQTIAYITSTTFHKNILNF